MIKQIFSFSTILAITIGFTGCMEPKIPYETHYKYSEDAKNNTIVSVKNTNGALFNLVGPPGKKQDYTKKGFVECESLGYIYNAERSINGKRIETERGNLYHGATFKLYELKNNKRKVCIEVDNLKTGIDKSCIVNSYEESNWFVNY